MAIVLEKKLEKGQKIDLVKHDGKRLTNFCVWCKWGNVIKKRFFGLTTSSVDVDLDLSCLMFDASGNPVDFIYSPLFRFGDKSLGLPNGKLNSIDGALEHKGDELYGGLDGEVITVNLNQVASNIQQIVFFLNIYNNNEYHGDFSGIPYVAIRMFEGTTDRPPQQMFASYDVATKTDCIGKRGLVMGKLYQRNGEWKFAAIGDAFEDRSIVYTIARVMKDYSK